MKGRYNAHMIDCDTVGSIDDTRTGCRIRVVFVRPQEIPLSSTTAPLFQARAMFAYFAMQLKNLAATWLLARTYILN